MENSYESIAKYYDSLFPLLPTEIAYYDKSMKNGETVLEVGCGTGSVSLELLKRNRKSVFYCVDSSVEMLNQLNIKLKEFETMYGETIKGGLKPIDSRMEDYSPTTKFDLILFPGQTIQVLPKSQIARELNRYLSFLNPGGRLIFTTFDPFSITKQGTKERLYSLQNINGTVFIATAKIDELTKDRFKFHLEVKHYGVDMALQGFGVDSFDVSVVDDNFVKDLLLELDGDTIEWRGGFGIRKNIFNLNESVVKLRRTT